MTPKLQLSPGEYVSDSYRAEINAWLIDLLGYQDDETSSVEKATVDPIEYNDANITSAPKTKKAKSVKKAKRTQVQPDIETFAGLLEGLEDSFYTMRVPPISGSWLAKKDLNAIKKLGIYIPTPLTIEAPDNPYIDKGIPLTAITSAYFVPKKHDEKNKMYPRFAFCIKAAKLPENVEATRGTPYQFGQCFEMTRTEDGHDMTPRTFWAWCWMVVTPNGEIRIPHEMRKVQTVIKRSCKGKNKAPKLAVLNSQWCLPTMAVVDEAQGTQSDFEKVLKSTFRQLLLWSHRRKDQWSVGVRKDGNRVTFSVAPEHTSAYFADRETVVNIEGKPKKIIHFVRPHTRANGADVKAHVRGLCEFDWKGYHCVVTAPELKGAIYTDIPIEPIEVSTKDTEDGYIETVELATMLADMEDAT